MRGLLFLLGITEYMGLVVSEGDFRIIDKYKNIFLIGEKKKRKKRFK